MMQIVNFYDNFKKFLLDGFYLIQKDTEDLEKIKLDHVFKDENNYIEYVYFISDSTVLIVTKAREIRMLNIKLFHPYDFETFQQN